MSVVAPLVCQILPYDLQSNTFGSPIVDSGGALAFDAERARLYWGTGNTIKWVDLSAPALQHTLITGIDGSVNGIYVDGPNDYIYWTESTSHKIQRADLVGQNQNIVTISTGVPSGASTTPARRSG